MSRTLTLIVILAGLIAPNVALGAGRALVFRSAGFTAVVGDADGRMLYVENSVTRERYRVDSDEARITINTGNINVCAAPLKLESRTSNTALFTGSALGLKIARTYVFPEGRSYFNRKLTITNESSEPMIVKSVSDGCISFGRPFKSVAFHDDNMDKMDEGSQVLTETEKPNPYRTSINVFLRGANGGLCAGLTYPYFKPILNTSRMALSYEVNYRLEPYETLELPTLFIGVYKKTGCTCRKALTWKPRILTTNQEEMDWGEVRVMQQVMRDYLPEQPVPWKGYYLRLNSWWADSDLRGAVTDENLPAWHSLIDRAKRSGCLDAMVIAPAWVGWTGFVEPCPKIDAIGEDAVFPTNPAIDNLVSYAGTRKLDLYAYCEPNSLARHYRTDRPYWKAQPTKRTGSLLNQNCHANDAYEDWFYRLICSAIDEGKLSGWAWDSCWMRRPCVCYGKDHGHEPGNCEFQQYRNVTELIHRLRATYPQLFMEVYWGLKEGGPWALKGLSSTENLYENSASPKTGLSIADDLRFQHWYNANYRFIPTYLNLAQINFTKETNGSLYSILSCLSASTHASLADWQEFKTDAEADRVFELMRKWKAWATANLAYLRDRIDLFGQPCRKGGIDGTAHIVGERGFLFVFNPWPRDQYGSVPLSEMIGLVKGSRWSIDEISSGTTTRKGVCSRGESFVFSIPGKTALLFELKPSTEKPSRPKAPKGVLVQAAFEK